MAKLSNKRSTSQTPSKNASPPPSSPSKRTQQPEPQGQPMESTTTLAIDIGATGIKAILLNQLGQTTTSHQKRPRALTPKPPTPGAVMDVIVGLVKQLGTYERVSVGFPGFVRNGVVVSAPTLGKDWKGFHIADALQGLLNKPVRAANDADVQGFGAIAGVGVELVLTLGTGVGTSLFIDGKLVPNLEIGNPKLSNRSLKRIGKKRWNKRLTKAIAKLEAIFHYDRLHIGGGNSRQVDISILPPNVTIISNLNGLIGGIALWHGSKTQQPEPSNSSNSDEASSGQGTPGKRAKPDSEKRET